MLAAAMSNRRAVGRVGEDAALKYLAERGHQVIYRNFRFSRYGEIDIICMKSGTICFIEVKSRAGCAFGTPAESVGYIKRRNIIAVANHFLRTGDYGEFKLRFDIVEVYYDKVITGIGEPEIVVREIRHIENAFGAN